MKDSRSFRFSVKRLLVVLALLSFGFVPAQVVMAVAEASPNAPGGPVLEDSFAVSSLWSGQTWYVYLHARDLDEDLQYIWFDVTQLGGASATEIIPLRCVYRAGFFGYVAIHLPRIRYGWETVRAEIKLKDAAGNYSAKRTHEVEVGAPTKPELPAKWQGATRALIGNIFFELDLDRGQSRR